MAIPMIVPYDADTMKLSIEDVNIREIPSTNGGHVDLKALEAIGKFRLAIWQQETAVASDILAAGVWLEDLDYRARHWIVTHRESLIGAARMSIHPQLQEVPDAYLWERAGITLPTPIAHFGKLVIGRSARGLGLGSRLNELRIVAAREAGARSIMVTASPANAKLLMRQGFTDTGIRETFPNRPGFEFLGLHTVL